MKRKSLFLAVVASMLLASCSSPAQPAQSEQSESTESSASSESTSIHTHTYSSEWSHDATHHWRAATCEHAEEIIDKAEHVFGEWAIDQEATYYVDGLRHRDCSVCGYSMSESYEKEFLNEEGLAFSLLDDGTYGVSAGQATELSKIEVPRKYNGKAVTQVLGYEVINDHHDPEPILQINLGVQKGFYGCTKLKTIVLPDTITTIGHGAFHGCTALESVTLGSGLKEIGHSAFYSCAHLTEITIPDSVETIWKRAFYGCNQLPSLTIPEGITAIGTETFQDCNALTSITIPSTVTSIGNSAFENCSSLQTLELPESLETIGQHAFWRCYRLTSIKMFDNVSEVGEEACGYCSALVYIDVTIVSDGKNFCLMKGKNYLIRTYDTFLGMRLFDQDGQEIVDFQVPTGVTKIEDYGFYNCMDIVSITLPASVNSIGKRAFAYCTALKTVNLSRGVSTISNDSVFDGCPLLEAINVDQGSSYFASAEGVLYTKNMTELVRCPEAKEGEYVVPDTVKILWAEAFFDCKKLTSIVLPETLTSIGMGAFYRCTSLTSIKLPNTMENGIIGDYAFTGCQRLASIELPDGVTKIGYGAFAACTSLTSIVIPQSVNLIDYYVFANCSALKWVVVPLVFWDNTNGYTYTTWFSNCGALEHIFFYRASAYTPVEDTYPGLCCFYHEEAPGEDGHTYWHFVDGAPVIWESEND